MNIHHLIIQIKNAQSANFESLFIRKKKSIARILDLLAKEGYISGYVMYENNIKVVLKNTKHKFRIIPNKFHHGNRNFISFKKLNTVQIQNQLVVVSTNKGIETKNNLVQKGIGGRILLSILLL